MSVATIAPGTAPIHILRPIFFRLVQGGVLPRVHSQLLLALQKTATEDPLEFLIPHLHPDSSISSYASFRESIVRQLFGSDALLRLRLRLAIADFCRVRSSFSVVPLHLPGSSNLPLTRAEVDLKLRESK
jgi:hypothetical protein